MTDPLPVFGIDLGTTYSCIARVNPDSERAEVLSNSEGLQTTPSVVFFETADNIVVGKNAKANAKVNASRVCSLVKRDMGNDDFRFNAFNQDYRAEAISSLILRKVVGDAVQQEGLPESGPFRAVITVPAYFGSKEREATRNAGRMAGLDVVGLLPEPVAAAFAYGLSRAKQPQHVLVYDLGGGTFDVTVVFVDGNVARCIATDGLRKLGGADWDECIVTIANERFVAEHGAADGEPKDDPEVLQRMALEAEEAKIALSRLEKVSFLVHHANKQTKVELTRTEFEERTKHLLEQAIERTRLVLDEAKRLGVQRIDKLLLVGGASMMPVVKRRLQEVFNLEGEFSRPNLSVAEGAALVGHLVAKGEYSFDTDKAAAAAEIRGLPGPRLGFVSAKSLGVVAVRGPDLKEEYVDYIIRRNSRLPASVTETYGTTRPNQSSVQVFVMEHREEESDKPLENETIHEAPLALPPGLPANSPIDVTFQLDLEGMLRVRVVERTSGRDLKIQIERRGMLTEEEIREQTTQMARLTVS